MMQLSDFITCELIVVDVTRRLPSYALLDCGPGSAHIASTTCSYTVALVYCVQDDDGDGIEDDDGEEDDDF